MAGLEMRAADGLQTQVRDIPHLAKEKTSSFDNCPVQKGKVPEITMLLIVNAVIFVKLHIRSEMVPDNALLLMDR